MKKLNRYGFTLVELLATIVVISLVFGIGYNVVIGIINNSKDKSVAILEENVLRTAELYVSEYDSDVYWDNNETCVAVMTLIDKGYLKREQVSDKYINEYVVLTRNDSYSIVSAKIAEDDDKNKCGGNTGTIKDITSFNFCIRREYGEVNNVSSIYREDELINRNVSVLSVTSSMYPGVANLLSAGNDKKMAGSYVITIKEDNSSQTKKIVCRIDKAKPKLLLSSNGGDGEVGTILESEIEHDKGTLSVKSTDNKFVTASIVNGNKLEMKIIAKREVPTYVVVTLKPDDITNYEIVSTTYTVGSVDVVSIPFPDDSDCTNYVYEGVGQYLVNQPNERAGYFYVNPKLGDGAEYNPDGYQVMARLSYGYVWEDIDKSIPDSEKTDEMKIYEEKNKDYFGTTKDYPLICHLSPGNPGRVNVKIDMNGGELGEHNSRYSSFEDLILNNGSSIVVSYNYQEQNINLPNPDDASNFSIIKNGFHAKNGEEWINKVNNRTYSDEQVDNSDDLCNAIGGDCTVVLSVNWVPNDCTIKFNANGGTGTMNDLYCANGEVCKLPPNKFTTSGKGFANWNTKSDATGNKYSDEAVVNICNATLYAEWGAEKYTVYFDPNSGSGSVKTKSCVPNTDCKLLLYKEANFSKVGSHGSVWNTKKDGSGTNYDEGKTVQNLASANGSITLYAKWALNVCTINFNPNGGVFNKNNNKRVQKMNYGTTKDDFWDAKGGTYSATYDGRHIDEAVAWIRTSDKKTFDETKGYSAVAVCPNLANGDQTVTLNVNWKINVCTIKFDENNGTFKKNNDDAHKKQYVNYGTKVTNLRNPLSYYDATKSGHTITASKAWISGINKAKFSQVDGVEYGSTKFCPSIKTGNQTVTLYVNWWKYQYRTCKTGKSCAAAGCAKYSSNCSSTYTYSGSCVCTYGGATMMTPGCNATVYNAGGCSAYCRKQTSYYSGTGTCTRKACNETCTKYNTSAATCGCSAWNGWTDTKCTVSTNTCERKQTFVRDQ